MSSKIICIASKQNFIVLYFLTGRSKRTESGWCEHAGTEDFPI